jgi:hypothetical protein
LGTTATRERIAEGVGGQSYSYAIRDVFFDSLADVPFFSGYEKRKTKRLQVQPEDLPYLGVYIIDEVMAPDGDANVGTVRFVHTARIGFSVIIAMNDEELAERTIDSAFCQIMDRLWTDARVTNLFDASTSSNPNNVRVESLTRGVRRHVFGSMMLDNTTPLAELQYEVSCLYRTSWWPLITDDFLRMDVYTRLNGKMAPIKTKYFFDPVTGEVTKTPPTIQQ